MDGLEKKLSMNISSTPYGNGTLSVTEYFNLSGTSSSPPPLESEPSSSLSLLEIIIMGTLFVCFSVVTIVGNVLVIISIKMDKQLQTISNYFLLSLSIADFLIGAISMPLYSMYILQGSWSFGPFLCDLWLAIDYLVSNASVLNLLIISFDRYFSVTRPLTYRAKRTTKKACIMIAGTWIISLLLWPPWIFSWPYFEGQRTVPSQQCYIQFLQTNTWVTIGTALGAFYIPISVMGILYWRIWRETKKRYRDLTTLFLVSTVGAPKTVANRHKVNGSKNCKSNETSFTGKRRKSAIRWLCCWSKSGVQPRAHETTIGDMSPIATSTATIEPGDSLKPSDSIYTIVIRLYGDDERNHTIKMIEHGNKEGINKETNKDGHNLNCGTGARESICNHQDHAQGVGKGSTAMVGSGSGVITVSDQGSSSSAGTVLKSSGIVSSSNTINVNSNNNNIINNTNNNKNSANNSTNNNNNNNKNTNNGNTTNSNGGNSSGGGGGGGGGGNARRIVSSNSSSSNHPQQPKSERKAAKTLSAILLAFAITWTPYSILVVIRVLSGDNENDKLWTLSYYLCYLNSTINPLCYALCNASFRRTYIRILKCKWSSRRNKKRLQKHWNLE
ncbi:muscarinic acetylcholine receptor M2-like isoform X2 [Brevipalpus obovatus]|uniref:muscarinic acetylcholine receptor M2-like isoform X2 n=1 Tax=Brevipalpus obovatus TaxID=246614 RepID=UPI003D9F12B4